MTFTSVRAQSILWHRPSKIECSSPSDRAVIMTWEKMRARGPPRHCWTTWMLFFFCSTHPRQRQLLSDRSLQPTFHFSMSSCCFLYCFTNSSSTFFSPSELVCNAGVTSFTVLSTSTPLIIRKHLRSGGNGPKVSSTSLFEKRSAGDFELDSQKGATLEAPFRRGLHSKPDISTHLCSSASCSMSPILWASCCRLFL